MPDRPRTRSDSGGATATAERTKPKPAPPRTDFLPPWKVLLHNDEVNYDRDVVNAIIELARLPRLQAMRCMLEAHRSGVALLMVTHREHAELLQEQFRTKKLTVTVEPEE